MIEVDPRLPPDLLLDDPGGPEDAGKRQLDRRRDRQKRVGDPFQTLQRLLITWTTGDDPAQFHLRESGNFRQAAHGESEQAIRSSECQDPLWIGRENEIGKYFVGEDGEAKGLQSLPF